MNNKEVKEILAIIEQLEKRLDSIEELAAWAIPAYVRFKKGQRVQFSALADRKLISRRTKGGVRRGTVVKNDGFSVVVLLDGYKKPRSYFHAFFERIGK